MECPNCSFQNIPGSALCARCRSRLDLEAVDFLPPRAAGGLSLRKVWWRLRSKGAGVEAWCAAAAERARAALHPHVNWATLRWSIVPGLGHIRRGRPVTGLLLMAVWLLLLLLAVTSVGSGLAWAFYTGALAFHCFVISLLLAPALAEMTIGRRILTGLAIYFVLILLVYGPAILISRGCVGVLPLRGVATTPLVANGDVILYSGRWFRPDSWHRGDLVVYRMRPHRAGNVVIGGGWGIDRIIGVPGDRVAVRDRALLVNGEPVPPQRMPLLDIARVRQFDIPLGEGEFAVLPSLMRLQGHVDVAGSSLLVAASRVREQDLVGKVWWRVRPWDRFGPVE